MSSPSIISLPNSICLCPQNPQSEFHNWLPMTHPTVSNWHSVWSTPVDEKREPLPDIDLPYETDKLTIYRHPNYMESEGRNLHGIMSYTSKFLDQILRGLPGKWLIGHITYFLFIVYRFTRHSFQFVRLLLIDWKS